MSTLKNVLVVMFILGIYCFVGYIDHTSEVEHEQAMCVAHQRWAGCTKTASRSDAELPKQKVWAQFDVVRTFE
jgi:hypothetical protein